MNNFQSTDTIDNKYCSSCGHAIPVDSEFCDSCGVRQNRPETVGNITPPAISQTGSASGLIYGSYRELGGFLKFIVIVNLYVVPILYFIDIIGECISASKVVSSFRQFGDLWGYGSFYDKLSALYISIILFYIVLIIFVSGVGVNFALKIKNRNPLFLRQLQICWIIEFVAVILFIIIFLIATHSLMNTVSMVIAFSVRLFFSLAIMFLWNLYYVKSVRVRIYMGSDEYLRLSVFNKDTQSPVAEDINSDIPRQYDFSNNGHSWICENCGNMISESPCPICSSRESHSWRCERCGNTIDNYPCHYCGYSK